MATQALHSTTRLESKTLPIILRNTELKDAARYSAILSDPANDSDPSASKMGIQRAQEIITKLRESANQPTILDEDGRVASGPSRVNMVVELTGAEGDGTVIGLGGYGAIKDWTRDGRKVRAGDAGVMIDPAYRSKGYASEAMKLAIDWGFTPVSAGGPQLDLVTITTLEDNAAMIKLTDEKLGLKGLGCRRESSEEDVDGAIEMYYELTKEAWESRKRTAP